MKIGLTIGVALAFISTVAWGTEGVEAQWAQTFSTAARAYDDNRLSDAIEGWKSLVAAGQTQPEVLFNLGNAYYRNGNLGEAIRAYRHAQMLAPRDPDIRANFGFAAQTAGIVIPSRHAISQLMLGLSQAEWQLASHICFGLLFACGASWILWPRFRTVTRPACVVLVVLWGVAFAGLGVHRDLQTSPECVVMTGDQKVFSGPLESATALFALPEGSLVRRIEPRGEWIQIESDSTRGWLKAATLSPVR